MLLQIIFNLDLHWILVLLGIVILLSACWSLPKQRSYFTKANRLFTQIIPLLLVTWPHFVIEPNGNINIYVCR